MNIQSSISLLLLSFASCFLIKPLEGAVPVAAYGTFFGTAGETVTAVTTDAVGNVFLVGTTVSQTLPGSAQSFQPARTQGFPNNRDIFIAKFDPTGKQLLWSTFFGGDSEDIPTALTVDSSGNILLAGTTQSSNFPAKTTLSCAVTTPALFQQKCTLAAYNKPLTSSSSSFLSKLSADGKQLIFSIALQNQGTPIWAIAADNQGGAMLASYFNGGNLLVHLSSAGDNVMYSVNLINDGVHLSSITAITVDSNGNCFIAGRTESPLLTTTPNAIQPQYSNVGLSSSTGLENAFLLEVDPAGSKILYGTYFGPKYFETTATKLAVAQNSIYIGGKTNATNLPASSGAYVTAPPKSYVGGTFGFVMKLTPGLSSLDALSYLGTEVREIIVGTNAHILTFDALVELSAPTLSVVTARPLKSEIDFALTRNSRWVVGNCYTGSCPSDVPTSNAYQTQADSLQAIYLLQEMNVTMSITSIVNAASQLPGPLAPGQLVTVFGSLLGPATGASGQVSSGFFGGSVSGTQVFFDGHSAPIFYAQANQVNVAIPCSLAGHTSTQVTVAYNGTVSAAFTMQLISAAPGIFTVDGSGTGQGAIFNQDFTLNSPSNPATRGSAIVLFVTGLPAPVCSDGQILPGANSILAVGGVNNEGAQVLYAGQAPNSVSGLQQVNLVVPNDSQIGPAIYVVVAASSQYSRSGVTIAVK